MTLTVLAPDGVPEIRWGDDLATELRPERTGCLPLLLSLWATPAV